MQRLDCVYYRNGRTSGRSAMTPMARSLYTLRMNGPDPLISLAFSRIVVVALVAYPALADFFLRKT